MRQKTHPVCVLDTFIGVGFCSKILRRPVVKDHILWPGRATLRVEQALSGDPLVEQDVDLPVESQLPGAQAERLASLLTLSHEPMFAWRLDGAIEFWNLGAQRLYRFSSDEAVGRNSHALLQTKFPCDLADLRAQLRSRRYWSGELRHICKDGREVIVDSRMQLVGDETVLEANRDVTEAAKFRAVFNQAGIFAGIMDLRGNLQEANELSLSWCGYTKDQVLDRPFWDTPWWRGSEEVRARIRFATAEAAAGRVFREELSYWIADGTARVVDFAMHPIRDRAGKVAFLNPTGIDITDRKRIEADLRDSAQRLNFLGSIVESSDDAIVSKDLNGVITSWNRGAERIFGYTAEEAVGQPITIVIPFDRYDEERSILTRVRRGERIDHFETIRQRRHGSLINVALTVSPVRNADGKVVGASKIARDITEQKRSQEQISTLAREAEHRSKNLLANVQAVVNLSQAVSPEELKKAIEGRIRALANVHSLFVQTRWIGAELSAIATQELAPYAASDGDRVVIDGAQILLEPTTAQAVAVALHELATNAAKYGSLSVDGGKVVLKWSQELDGQLKLRWTESGGPPVQAPTRKGFGGRIIQQMITQLKGTAHFDWQPEGLVCEIALRA
jgi:PAS domain S-box-containing protein